MGADLHRLDSHIISHAARRWVNAVNAVGHYKRTKREQKEHFFFSQMTLKRYKV
jgi:hypothetical protein